MLLLESNTFTFVERKKWKPEVKDSWVTFFSSIVKVMKKNEMKVRFVNNYKSGLIDRRIDREIYLILKI